MLALAGLVGLAYTTELPVNFRQSLKRLSYKKVKPTSGVTDKTEGNILNSIYFGLEVYGFGSQVLFY